MFFGFGIFVLWILVFAVLVVGGISLSIVLLVSVLFGFVRSFARSLL
jgi:hypothetical protein